MKTFPISNGEVPRFHEPMLANYKWSSAKITHHADRTLSHSRDEGKLEKSSRT